MSQGDYKTSLEICHPVYKMESLNFCGENVMCGIPGTEHSLWPEKSFASLLLDFLQRFRMNSVGLNC